MEKRAVIEENLLFSIILLKENFYVAKRVTQYIKQIFEEKGGYRFKDKNPIFISN